MNIHKTKNSKAAWQRIAFVGGGLLLGYGIAHAELSIKGWLIPVIGSLLLIIAGFLMWTRELKDDKKNS